jgi:hypothetical protein
MTRLPAGTVESKASSIPPRPSPRILRFENHDRLGQLYRAAGEPERASQFLRMAAAGGVDSARLRLQLASLAFSQGKRRAGFGEIAQAFKQSAVWTSRIGKKALSGVRKPFLLAYEFWGVR